MPDVTSPAISVVIPTFNQPDFLEEALKSVLAQTFRDFEVIVVNDGSTDDTAQRLEGYSNRLRIINQENLGIGAARNRGIEAATGRYVALLDHDDTWHPDKLAIQYQFMRAHPEAVGCSVPFTYSSPAGTHGFDLSIRGDGGLVEDALKRYAAGQLFLLSSVMMLDRKKVGDLRYETERASIEDVALQIRLLLRGPYGIAGEGPLAVYRVHSSNSANSAAHLFRGIKRLRTIERSGGFMPCTSDQQRVINALISALGRKMLIAQAAVGQRLRALSAYIGEFPHQLRNMRLKFLLIFPMLLLVPRAALRRFPSFRVRE
jgi:glycosyltransferase involved in cell wall biosynthesis